MNVGILAANLPTLKPLFANFFGHMRTFTKGHSTGSGSVLPTPFKSNGYFRHDGNRANRTGTSDEGSYALNDMSQRTKSRKKNSYDEILVLGKESYGVDAGRGRRQSAAGASDESILGHERLATSPGLLDSRSQGLARNMTILRTTEVSISR